MKRLQIERQKVRRVRECEMVLSLDPRDPDIRRAKQLIEARVGRHLGEKVVLEGLARSEPFVWA